MSFKKYNQEARGVSWFLLAVAFGLLVILAVIAYRRDGKFIDVPANRTSPPILAASTAQRSFEILAKSATGYTARDVENKEESNIIISNKNLKPGTVIILKKYVKAANGLVSQEAQILPPVPATKPIGKLPDKPE